MMTELEREIKQLKLDVFHKYVDKRVIRYPVSRQGQSVESYLDIKNNVLGAHFNELHKKYGFKKSWEALHTEYSYQIFNSIQKFKPEGVEEKEGWKSILKGENQLLENQLLRYIRTNANYKIWEFANPNAFRTTTTKEGEKIHYTLVMEMEGLDHLLTGDIDDIPSIQLTDENALFDSTMYSYYISYFQRWFDEHKEDFLADSQLQFLEDLRKLSKDHMLTKEEFEEGTGVKWRNYSKRLRTIENSIERAWNEQQPAKKSRRQVSLEPKIKYLEGFMDIVENADPLTQNLELTDYLYKGMYDRQVEYDVFKVTNRVLNTEELILFNRITKNKNGKRVSLRTSSLVKLIEGIEEMLESLLEDYNTEAEIEIERADNNNPNTPDITEPKRRKSEVITYNKKGHIIGRQVKLVRDTEEHSNIYYLLPTGAISKDRG